MYFSARREFGGNRQQLAWIVSENLYLRRKANLVPTNRDTVYIMEDQQTNNSKIPYEDQLHFAIHSLAKAAQQFDVRNYCSRDWEECFSRVILQLHQITLNVSAVTNNKRSVDSIHRGMVMFDNGTMNIYPGLPLFTLSGALGEGVSVSFYMSNQQNLIFFLLYPAE